MQKARRLDKKGPTFQVERGVKQGDPLSPKLIVAVLESIFRKLNWNDMGLKWIIPLTSQIRRRRSSITGIFIVVFSIC